MSMRTPNQDKALHWYLDENSLKPQLSTHPVYYFVDKDGNKTQRNIIHIMADWERSREEQRRANRRRTA